MDCDVWFRASTRILRRVRLRPVRGTILHTCIPSADEPGMKLNAAVCHRLV